MDDLTQLNLVINGKFVVFDNTPDNLTYLLNTVRPNFFPKELKEHAITVTDEGVKEELKETFQLVHNSQKLIIQIQEDVIQIAYEFNNDNNNLTFEEIIDSSYDVLYSLKDKINFDNFNRLGFVTKKVGTNIPESFMTTFSNIIEDNGNILEYQQRFVQRDRSSILNEEVNKVSQLHLSVPNESEQKVFIANDINTLFENKEYRFTFIQSKDFFKNEYNKLIGRS